MNEEDKLRLKIIENKFSFLFTILTITIITLVLLLVALFFNTRVPIYITIIYNLVFTIITTIQYFIGSYKYNHRKDE